MNKNTKSLIDESFTSKVVDYTKKEQKNNMKKAFGNMFAGCMDELESYIRRCEPVRTFAISEYLNNVHPKFSIEHSDKFAELIRTNLLFTGRKKDKRVVFTNGIFPEGYVFDFDDLEFVKTDQSNISIIDGIPYMDTSKEYTPMSSSYDYSICIRDLHNILKLLMNKIKPYKGTLIDKISKMTKDELEEYENKANEELREKKKELQKIQDKFDELSRCHVLLNATRITVNSIKSKMNG